MMSAIIFWQEAVKFVEGAASPVSILPTSAPFTKTSGVQCGQQIVQYCPAASVSAINAPSRRMRCSKKQKQTSPKPGLQPLTIQAISLRDFFARCVIKDGLQKVLSACSPAYGKLPLTSPSAYSSGNPQPPAYAPQLAANVESSGI
jgi:hypothetical protein